MRHSLSVKSLITLCFGILLASLQASAMEFELVPANGRQNLRATGEIKSGDTAKFIRYATQVTLDNRGIRAVYLNSPGGDVSEAINLGTQMRLYNFAAYVEGSCASACSQILFFSGKASVLLNGGRLGFHTCYNSSTRDRNELCNERISQFAVSNGFPYGSLQLFMGLAGPDNMYWLTNLTASCYGLERLPGDADPIRFEQICPTAFFVIKSSGKADTISYPSFDCRRRNPNDKIESAICFNYELAHLDGIMGALYLVVQNKEQGSNLLGRSQRDWIKLRSEKCGNATNQTDMMSCVSELSSERIGWLLTRNGTPIKALRDFR